MKNYPEVRSQMRPGDVIAFGGKGRVSRIIKVVQGVVPVSHVGVVIQTRVLDDATGRYFNEVIESTSLDGFLGVSKSRLSRRLESYSGEVWWLPLSDRARELLNLEVFWNWLYAQEGKPYDFQQAVQAGLDSLESVFPWTRAEEDFGKLFCSELVAGALEAAGVIPPINASEVTPIGLCRWKIYREIVQLAGDPKLIPQANAFPMLSETEP